MADNNKIFSYTRVALSMLLFELTAAFLIMPKSMVEKAQVEEYVRVKAELGQTVADHVNAQTFKFFNEHWVETGVLKMTYDFFLNWDGDKSSPAVDDRGLGRWFKERLDTIWYSFFLCYYRAFIIFEWLPYWLALLTPLALDAFSVREIKKWQFSYTSPTMHLMSFQMVALVLIFFVHYPFLPFSMTTYVIPCGMAVASLGSWLYVSNLQKRI